MPVDPPRDILQYVPGICVVTSPIHLLPTARMMFAADAQTVPYSYAVEWEVPIG